VSSIANYSALNAAFMIPTCIGTLPPFYYLSVIEASFIVAIVIELLLIVGSVVG
jgi:hypothetical protein